jgi:acyl-CoA thioester hydrolase
MTAPFATRLDVRLYDLDAQGHLSGAAYLQYANHAFWACARAAGVDIDRMLASGIGPVNLETTIRYRRELRGGDGVDVTCELHFDSSKRYDVAHQFLTPDGELAAEVVGTYGLLDLSERHLVPDPKARWRQLAARPEVLGLAA